MASSTSRADPRGLSFFLWRDDSLTLIEQSPTIIRKDMNKFQRKYLEYIMLLPRTLAVDIYRAEEGGFWAKVRALPGCNTQGEDFIDLVDMINDAIFTYFNVPQKMRSALGHYLPHLSDELRKKAGADTRHAAIEHAMTKMIKGKKTLAFNNLGLS